MRTTLALDDELFEKAQAYTGLREKSAVVREALRALIEREIARRLAGSEPDLAAPPRRRSKTPASIDEFIGCLRRPGTKALSIEEISDAAARGWAGRR